MNDPIAKELFAEDENQLIIIAYATYCFVQRSANDFFQRMTYSSHQKKHLVKPFVVTASNGRIVDVFGLFEATKNDAAILLELMTDSQGLKSILNKGDIVILDRGFMDCIDELKDKYG